MHRWIEAEGLGWTILTVFLLETFYGWRAIKRILNFMLYLLDTHISIDKRRQMFLGDFDAETGPICWHHPPIFRRGDTGYTHRFFGRHARRSRHETLGPRNGGQRVTGVLSVGGDTASLRDHRDARCLGDGADLGKGGQAADPVDIGLEDVDEVATGGVLEGHGPVPVLTGG